MIDLSQVEGRIHASTVRKMGDLIENHREEAIAVIRSWMYQNGYGS